MAEMKYQLGPPVMHNFQVRRIMKNRFGEFFENANGYNFGIVTAVPHLETNTTTKIAHKKVNQLVFECRLFTIHFMT